ncbi:MAG TPA: Do family serine endopeptidase [Candidatus Binatia bacterium]|jgi:serine protease Do|nr:Do family serine endopeptidase [Candidatus Binatia bacterium]
MSRICRRYLQGAAASVLAFSLWLWGVVPLCGQDCSALAQNEAGAATAVAPTAQLPSFASIVKSAAPAVVNISVTAKLTRRRRTASPRAPFGEGDPLEEFFHHGPRSFGPVPSPGPQRSLGSGFLISPDGYIITNNHVIGDAEKITVSLSDTEEYTAKVVGADDKTDLALLKIPATHPLPRLVLGQSADLQIGDWVVAIGNSFGLARSVTAGIVSAKGRVLGSGPYDDFIQTDASINPGNSGGPLLNLKGEVVGINAAIFTQSGGNIGIGFATPIDLAKSVVSELKEKGSVTRAWLGVSVQAVTPSLAKSFGLAEPTGALVAEVSKGGPADKAGLRRGDVITRFHGTPIKDSHELPSLVARMPVGAKTEVTVSRGGRAQAFTVTLGKMAG